MHFQIRQDCKSRKILALVILITLFFPGFLAISRANGQDNQTIPRTSDSGPIDSILWKVSHSGIPGTYPTMPPFVSNFTEVGPNYIIVGTDKGLAVLAMNGSTRIKFDTFQPVIDIAVAGDLSGDDQRDLVAVVLDQDHPNIYAISSTDGAQLWSFNPTILGFNKDTLLQQNYTTYSWDIESVDDLNNDGVQDLVLSSWFRVFALSGITGQVLWTNSISCSDDVWKIAVIDDINLDNQKEIIVASEKGEVISLQGQTGQKIWSYTIQKVTYSTSYYTPTDFPVSISDVKVGPDLDGDGASDLLITGDDGIFRILSSKSGAEIAKATIYDNNLSPNSYVSFGGEWYTYQERLFTKSGAKIFPVPDMNGDAIGDWMIIAYNLDVDYSSPSRDKILGTFLDVKATASGQVPLIVNASWSDNLVFGDASSPCVITVGSEKRLYYHSTETVTSTSGLFISESISAGVFYYLFNAEEIPTANPTLVAEIEDSTTEESEESGSQSEQWHETYLIDIGDITADGVSDLFGFTKKGTYYVLDTQMGDILWKRYLHEYTPLVTTIGDLNDDGVADLLYSSQCAFSPEWGASSSEKNLHVDLCAINGRSGSVIWRLQLPSTVYEGVMDLRNLGDLTSDGFADFACWIIPSYIPSEIKSYIMSRTGKESIDTVISNREDIYRGLMADYTRVLYIDGASGVIQKSQPLFQSPYKFYRDNVTLGDYNCYYNRINDQAPRAWFHDDSRTNYDWSEEWGPSTLRHVDTIDIKEGQRLSGNAFDTWDEQDNNYTVEAKNTTAQLQVGGTREFNSRGLTTQGDGLIWRVNSSNVGGGGHKLVAEARFNQSQPLDATLTGIKVTYTGNLSTSIDSYTVSAWDFTHSLWVRISGNDINTTTFGTSVEMYLSSTTDFCKKDENNITIIKIEGTDTEPFAAAIDKLTVKYLYKHHNYTVDAVYSGSQWQTILNCSIPLDLSDSKSIGVMEYTVSELERISALKIQTGLWVNRTGSFKVQYSLYNVTKQSWVSCNWTNVGSWASGTNVFPELYGSWGSNRSSYEQFTFDLNEYHTDEMFVTMAGTRDCSSSSRLDYENKTSLSHFVDVGSKTVLLQINVTSNNAFNLSLDSIGMVAMAWGLAPGKYDETYAFDCVGQQFTTSQLLNLQVQDFQVINGTGDDALDVLAITGYNKYDSTYPCSSSLRLFDLKNGVNFTKWTTNDEKLPCYKVRAQIPNTSGTNSWILTGAFWNGSGRYYVSKIVENAHWDSAISRSRFANFSDDFVAIDFDLSLPSDVLATSLDNVEEDYFFLTTIALTTNGVKGILVFKETAIPLGQSYHIYGEFRILNATNFAILGVVPCQITSTYVNFANILTGGAQILLAPDDFNGDGFLDHVVISSTSASSSDPYSYSSGGTSILRVFSGNVGGSGVANQLYQKEFPGLTSDTYNYMGGTSNLQRQMPSSSIGDTDGDGAAELAVGLEVSSYGGAKGSSIFILNIKQGTEKESICTPYVSLYYGNMQIQKHFYSRMATMDATSSQKTSVVFVQRTNYKNQLSGGYKITETSEILDVQNQTVLLRIQVEIDAIFRVHDMNNDGEGEYLLSSGGILYCYNSAFKVTLSNIIDGETRPGNEFTVEWTSTATRPVYELVVDDMGYGTTSNPSAHVSLGSGSRHLEVMLYDSSGIFIAIDDATIIIPPNITMPLITIFFISGMVVAFIWRKRRRAGWRRRNSYDLEKTASHTTLGNPTKATKDENVSKLNAKGGLFGGN